MTPTLSSFPAQPHQLDLASLNAAREVVTKALQNQVIIWEQNAADAAAQGDFRSAQQFKEWAFAADLAVHTASMAVGAVILDTLDSLPIVEDQRTVTLPNLTRSTEQRYLDDLATEVASHQPEPCSQG
jgi:hypothetical protein